MNYCILIETLLEQGMYERAMSVYQEIEDGNNSSSDSSSSGSTCESSMYQEKDTPAPTTATTTIETPVIFHQKVIRALCRWGGGLGFAMSVFKKLKLGAALANHHIGIDTYEDLISIAIREREWEEAERLLSCVVGEGGLEPGTRTYNLLMEGYRKTKDWGQVLRLLKILEGMDLPQ